jgi:hypothetical protein
LPLDFPSQVVLTSSFVLSILPTCLPEVRRALAATALASSRLARAHTSLLSALRGAGTLVATALFQGTWAAPPVGGGSIGGWGDAGAGGAGEGSDTCDAGGPMSAALAASDRTAMLAVVACCWVLFMCAAVPLWVAYHAERVHKQRWLTLSPLLHWSNPPAGRVAGAWPPARAAALQLGVLLLIAAAASEVVVAMLHWMSLPL